jgi:RNA polymerase sigma-70 factor (ECF subfamily)
MELVEVRQEAVDTEQLQHGLALLAPQHREVLVLWFFEDMNYEEIARVTNCAPGTVRSRIHYAKQALKDALERKLP